MRVVSVGFCVSRCQDECKMPTWPCPMAHWLRFTTFLFPSFIHFFPEMFVSKGWKFIAPDCINHGQWRISTVFLKAGFCSPCFASRLVPEPVICQSHHSSAQSWGKFNLGSACFVLLLVCISLRFLTLWSPRCWRSLLLGLWAPPTFACKPFLRHYKSSMKVFLVVVSLNLSISRWFPL